jgi:hypothetical protein
MLRGVMRDCGPIVNQRRRVLRDAGVAILWRLEAASTELDLAA